ncbi:MAG: hypothetical protein WCA46_12530, partial [Actinocatenispora sp.]
MITRLARSRPGTSSRPASRHERRVSLLLAIMMAAVAVLFWPAQPANAAPSHCNLKQWQDPQQVANC